VCIRTRNKYRNRMVLDLGRDQGPRPKCFFRHAGLPSYIDNAQPPTKKEPFRTVLEHNPCHTVRDANQDEQPE